MPRNEKMRQNTSDRNDNHGPHPRGRTLKAGHESGRFTVVDWQLGGDLRWACAIAEPRREALTVRALLTILSAGNREVRATAREVFGQPTLLTPVDQKLLTERRRLFGTPPLRDDRTSRRLVQGDSRQAAGAV